ncbi:MAG TPA: prepilin-type N-terminal cleavage/methylation domain-containing protein [Kineosporiaceae bacterium]|nr:prepilin-type N-terminal cleavage/methylation domain-containing protein [Kineosporiaceae bacterium]
MFTKQLREARENDGGFTLIELLIVIVVLGVLAGIVVFGVSKFRGDSALAACQAEMKTVQTAEEAYFAKNNAYTDNATLFSGGYIKTQSTTNYTVTATPGTGARPTTYAVHGVLADNTTCGADLTQ